MFKQRGVVVPVVINNQPHAQSWLTDRMNRLGYECDAVCFGLAHMAIQAILLDQLPLFFERLTAITAIPVESFTRDGIIGLSPAHSVSFNAEVRAFFEGIMLYQQPKPYSHVFEYRHIYQNSLRSVPLTQSVALEEQGGMFLAGYFSGIYTLPSLTSYFKGLQKIVAGLDHTRCRPVALVILSYDHAIAIGYSPRQRAWYFINVNAINNQPIPSAWMLARETMSTMSANGVTALLSEIYGTNQHAKFFRYLHHAWRKTSEWQKIHTITRHKLVLADSMKWTWLHLAIEKGEYGTVRALLRERKKANITFSETGKTPLYQAVKSNQMSMLSLLLQAGANPNHSFNERGRSPLALAVKREYVPIVRMLLQAKAVANGQSSYPSPLYLAVERSNTKMVSLLKQYGASEHTVVMKPREVFNQFLASTNEYVRRRAKLFIAMQTARGVMTTDVPITPYQLACLIGNKFVLDLLAWDSTTLSGPNPDILDQLHQFINSFAPGVFRKSGDFRRMAAYQAAHDLLFLYRCFVHLEWKDIPMPAKFRNLRDISQAIISESSNNLPTGPSYSGTSHCHP
jgi:hypothetical protein